MAAEPVTVGWFSILTPTVLPIITLLLGFGIAIVTGSLEHRRTLKREREARDAIRRDQRIERRDNFQRQTLLELQEAMFDLARTTGAMHHRDMMSYVKTGEWEKNLFPDDLAEKDRLANARSQMLVVRVRDKTVRDLVQAFKDYAVKVTFADSRDASDLAWRQMADVNVELNNRVGELLITLDDESVPPKV